MEPSYVLLNKVNSASTKADLSAIWDDLSLHSSFERQNKLMIDVIKTISEEEANKRKCYFNTSSLTDIFPNELITHILSFDCDNRTHPLVNKTMKKSFEINERMIAKQYENEQNAQKQRLQSIQDEKHDYLADFIDEDTEYWVVDMTRHTLTAEETAKGYHGPVHDLREAIQRCRDINAVIFVFQFEQSHLMDSYYIPSTLNKKIAFVGIGERDNIYVEFYNEDESRPVNGNDNVYLKKDVYFENLFLRTHDKFRWKYCVEELVIEQNAFLKNVKFSHRRRSIHLFGNFTCILSDLCKECYFDIYGASKNVEIRGCTMKQIRLKECNEGQIDSVTVVGNLVDLDWLIEGGWGLEFAIQFGGGTSPKRITVKDNAVNQMKYFMFRNEWFKTKTNVIQNV